MPKKQGLEYEAQVPAFLQRMKAGQAALDGRHDVQIPRTRGGMGRNSRLDMRGEDGEDDPVIVDEYGEVVTKEELESKEQTDTQQPADTNEIDEADLKMDTSKVSSGFGKKRKAAKIIGEKATASDDESAVPEKSLKESTRDLRDVVAQNKTKADRESAFDKSTKKTKRKKVKLSFDEPEL